MEVSNFSNKKVEDFIFDVKALPLNLKLKSYNYFFKELNFFSIDRSNVYYVMFLII